MIMADAGRYLWRVRFYAPDGVPYPSNFPELTDLATLTPPPTQHVVFTLSFMRSIETPTDQAAIRAARAAWVLGRGGSLADLPTERFEAITVDVLIVAAKQVLELVPATYGDEATWRLVLDGVIDPATIKRTLM